jgi:hypothetical protein
MDRLGRDRDAAEADAWGPVEGRVANEAMSSRAGSETIGDGEREALTLIQR